MSFVDSRALRAGSKIIQVKGRPNTPGRKLLIDEAIKSLQSDAYGEALANEFLGMKNYASFGDQRCDCKYGYGPTHGNIVFSVARSSDFRNKSLNKFETTSAIYYLLAERDFEYNKANEQEPYLNLWQVIEQMDEAEAKFQKFKNLIPKDETEYMQIVLKG